jgi:hypothetical protein
MADPVAPGLLPIRWQLAHCDGLVRFTVRVVIDHTTASF